MTPERWQQIKELFNSALEQELDERCSFLTDACAGDEDLRREVSSLLSSHERDGRFIDAPAFE
jgi:serine/threonine-protein kinase